jgi:hypothetical protein
MTEPTVYDDRAQTIYRLREALEKIAENRVPYDIQHVAVPVAVQDFAQAALDSAYNARQA